MIINHIAKCEYCEEKILLRFQLGSFDIPFEFSCPKCGVSISGNKYKNNTELHITNSLVIEEDIKNVLYYGNFSTEFINRKITKFKDINDIVNDGFSPYIYISGVINKDDVFFKRIKKISVFLDYRTNTWNKLLPLYELFFNYKINFIKKPILNFSKNYIIKNELDAFMSLHQLTILGIKNMMQENILDDYVKISKSIYEQKNIKETIKFINYLKTKIKMNELSQKVIEIYKKWFNDFEKYMAIVLIDTEENLNKINKKEFGISTINFKDMKTFYEETYELILELITIPIGLNNIVTRGNYDDFSEKSPYKNFDSYFAQSKYNRTKSLMEEEKYSACLYINRNIRNAISHFDYKLNKESQVITFYDKYGDKTEMIEMFLLDFAFQCYKNIKNIIYMNELLYNIRKLDYVNQGMKPNINHNFKEINI